MERYFKWQEGFSRRAEWRGNEWRHVTGWMKHGSFHSSKAIFHPESSTYLCVPPITHLHSLIISPAVLSALPTCTAIASPGLHIYQCPSFVIYRIACLSPCCCNSVLLRKSDTCLSSSASMCSLCWVLFVPTNLPLISTACLSTSPPVSLFIHIKSSFTASSLLVSAEQTKLWHFFSLLRAFLFLYFLSSSLNFSFITFRGWQGSYTKALEQMAPCSAIDRLYSIEFNAWLPLCFLSQSCKQTHLF